MNLYDKLPTDILQWLHGLCLAIHHAGHANQHSKEELRAIKAELYIREKID